MLLDLFPHGTITVVEIDREQFQTLKNQFERFPVSDQTRIRLYRANTARLPEEFFPDQSFNFIHATGIDIDTFYDRDSLGKFGGHLDDERKFSQEMMKPMANEFVRLLKPGGYLLHDTNAPDRYDDPPPFARAVTADQYEQVKKMSQAERWWFVHVTAPLHENAIFAFSMMAAPTFSLIILRGLLPALVVFLLSMLLLSIILLRPVLFAQMHKYILVPPDRRQQNLRPTTADKERVAAALPDRRDLRMHFCSHNAGDAEFPAALLEQRRPLGHRAARRMRGGVGESCGVSIRRGEIRAAVRGGA